MKKSLLLVAGLVLAIGLAGTAQAAPMPWVANANTMHLWHFDVTTGNYVADQGNSPTSIYLYDPGTTGMGATGYTGFGSATNTAVGQGLIAVNSGSGTTETAYTNTQLLGSASGDFTLEVLIKFNTMATQQYSGNGQAMILGHDGQNGSRNFDLKWSNGSIMFAANPDVAGDQISFDPRNASVVGASNVWTATDWFHLAVTWTASTKTAQMYWTKMTPTDTAANLVATKVLTDPTMTSTNTFTVGAAARAWDQRYIDGAIDEVRISNVALTPTQMFNIPEPATMSLLVLGGLAMLKRRK